MADAKAPILKLSHRPHRITHFSTKITYEAHKCNNISQSNIVRVWLDQPYPNKSNKDLSQPASSDPLRLWFWSRWPHPDGFILRFGEEARRYPRWPPWLRPARIGVVEVISARNGYVLQWLESNILMPQILKLNKNVFDRCVENGISTLDKNHLFPFRIRNRSVILLRYIETIS